MNIELGDSETPISNWHSPLFSAFLIPANSNFKRLLSLGNAPLVLVKVLNWQ